MNAPRPRPVIDALPRYVPGARGSQSGPPPIKLSSNETPWGPLPSVAEAIARAGAQAHRYPDMFAVELTERIAARRDLEAEQVAVGGGSVAVLQHILQAYCDAGDEVVYAWRSFEAYPIITAVSGAVSVQVPLTPEGRHDLPAMASAVTDRTKVVIVCSPNNPTGAAVGAEEFEEFMAQVPASVLVVLDEAYAEFVTDADAVTGGEVLRRHGNVLVARTFSKAYGLAALRVGYAMGPAELVAPVRACVTPFSVSGVAQAAAVASLEAEEELLERVARVVAERERVVPLLSSQGWEFPDPQGNFFWMEAGRGTETLAALLASLEPPILVRPFAGEGVRITFGEPHENDALLVALAIAAGDV